MKLELGGLESNQRPPSSEPGVATNSNCPGMSFVLAESIAKRLGEKNLNLHFLFAALPASYAIRADLFTATSTSRVAYFISPPISGEAFAAVIQHGTSVNYRQPSSPRFSSRQAAGTGLSLIAVANATH